MQIDKHIPLPPPPVPPPNEFTDLASRMEIGDSVLLDNGEQYVKVFDALRSHKMRCYVEKQDGGKLRVWRTE